MAMADVREKLVELESALRKSMCRGYDDVTDIEYIEYEETAKNLIANGVTIQRWIPVTERLPKPYKRVLVCTRYKSLAVGRIFDEKWVISWNNDYLPPVTHWMPLPEAPGVCHGLRPRNDGEVDGDG